MKEGIFTMASSAYHHKKIAVINDLSGFGRCSLTVAIPVISSMKIQCCPVPTSILSSHTGYPHYFFHDCTNLLEPYLESWKALDLRFDAISSGFLGSAEQIRIVRRMFERFCTPETIRIVDPVMGDNGRTYVTCTPDLCAEMKQLAAYADILTPNLTEACILTGIPWHDGKWTMKELLQLSRQLADAGAKKIVITGIPQGDFIANFWYESEGGQSGICRTHKIGASFSGTGDMFAAIISAEAVNGAAFRDSVYKASHFIKKCIAHTIALGAPKQDGVCFEDLLHTL